MTNPLTPPPMTEADQNPIKKPEALRLADALRDGDYLLSVERNATEAALRTQHALLERAWNNLDAATSYSRKSARDSHTKLLADLTAHLEPKP